MGTVVGSHGEFYSQEEFEGGFGLKTNFLQF